MVRGCLVRAPLATAEAASCTATTRYKARPRKKHSQARLRHGRRGMQVDNKRGIPRRPTTVSFAENQSRVDRTGADLLLSGWNKTLSRGANQAAPL